MPATRPCGLDQARSQLSRIVSDVHACICSIISQHGKPHAAVVPLQALDTPRAGQAQRRQLLASRGTGKGFGRRSLGTSIGGLRDEWSARGAA